MSDIQIDDSLIGLVEPVGLPEQVGETWREAYLDPVCRWLPVADDTWRVWPDRPNCGHFYGGSYWYGIETAYPIMTYATAWRAAQTLGCDCSLPADTILAHAIAAIRYLGFTHDSGPEECVRAESINEACSRTKWGGEGKNFFQASQTGSAVAHMCLGAWLLWEELDDETRQLAINVAQWYGDRWSDEEPPVGTYGNTLTEENGWTAAGLDVVANFLRGHPRAGKWREAADAWMAGITVFPFDLQRNTADLQGRPVSAWTTGATSHADFTTENHGFVHPSYLASAIGFAGSGLLTHALAGLDVPEVVRFNREPIYETMKKLAESDGPMLAVQGMDWWYLTHATLLPISTPSAHTTMNLLFGDRQAAYLERRCVGTVRQVMDSLADGHLPASDPESRRINAVQSFRTYERSAMVSFAGTFLLHWLLGDGAKPCDEAEFRKWQQGVHVFPHGGFITRKGKRTTASFSWRNRPVIVVQPDEGTWAVTPHMTSLTGRLETDAPEPPGMRTISQRVDEEGDGFAATAVFERNDGAALQRVALVAPTDRVAFYFEDTVAQRDLRVLAQRSGEVGVRNEDYSELPELAPGARVICSDDGDFEAVSHFGGDDEWFFAPSARWVNVDDRIGYVVFGGKGVAYQAHHNYDHKFLGMEDFLILSHIAEPRDYTTGEEISRLAAVICPNQRAGATARQAEDAVRLRAPKLADAMIADGWLAAVNFADRSRTVKLNRRVAEGDSLPVFEGKLTVREGRAVYETPLAAGQARALNALARVTVSGPVEVFGTPTGEVFVSAPGAATVTL